MSENGTSDLTTNKLQGERYRKFCELVSPVLQESLSISKDSPDLSKYVDELFLSVPEWMRADAEKNENPPPLYPDAMVEVEDVDDMNPYYLEMMFKQNNGK